MRKLGVAVIGTGFWGKSQARVFHELPNANLVAVCDVNRQAAETVAEKFNAESYTDVDRLLSRRDVEAVTVCTPTITHRDVASKAIEAGKHVLVEKPMTNTVKEAKELIGLAEKHGVKLLPGHIERFNPGVSRLKSQIEQGRVGKVILLLARRVTRWPERIGDVGVIRDTAIHDIDVMRYILNDEVEAVYARAGSLKHKLEDYAEIMLHFRKGETGFIDANWLTPRKIRTLIVTGSEATITLDYLTQEMSIEDSQRVEKPSTGWSEPLKNELNHFVESILETHPSSVTAGDGLRAIEICEAALESSRTGKTIYF